MAEPKWKRSNTLSRVMDGISKSREVLTNTAETSQKQGVTIDRFKSAADTPVNQASQTTQWRPPLQRHLNAKREVQFISIRVRVLNGDAEHDFQARFEPGNLQAEVVTEAISEKEGLSSQEANLFGLWVVSKDLELQLRPKQDIFALMIFWNRWMMKYTHFPEADNPSHPINRHWFIYRREAAVSLVEETGHPSDPVIRLLYGEAKRNVLTRRWICTPADAAALAAIQLQIIYGDFNEGKFPPGSLINDDRYEQLIPVRMPEKMKPVQWEEAILKSYKQWQGLDSREARNTFLEIVREWPCYGCSFFPACMELPPSGFFEYRTQNYFIGLNYNGIVVIDADLHKYVHAFVWESICWESTQDYFTIQLVKDMKIKSIVLITPQAPIINNVALRLQSKWRHGSRTISLLEKYSNKRSPQHSPSSQVPLPQSATGAHLNLEPNVHQHSSNQIVPVDTHCTEIKSQKPSAPEMSEQDAMEEAILQEYLRNQAVAQKRRSMLPPNDPGYIPASNGIPGNIRTLADISAYNQQQQRQNQKLIVPTSLAVTTVGQGAINEQMQEQKRQEIQRYDDHAKSQSLRIDINSSSNPNLNKSRETPLNATRPLSGSQVLSASISNIVATEKHITDSIEMMASATQKAIKQFMGSDEKLQEAIRQSPTRFTVVSKDTSETPIQDTVLPEGFEMKAIKLRSNHKNTNNLLSDDPNRLGVPYPDTIADRRQSIVQQQKSTLPNSGVLTHAPIPEIVATEYNDLKQNPDDVQFNSLKNGRASRISAQSASIKKQTSNMTPSFSAKRTISDIGKQEVLLGGSSFVSHTRRQSSIQVAKYQTEAEVNLLAELDALSTHSGPQNQHLAPSTSYSMHQKSISQLGARDHDNTDSKAHDGPASNSNDLDRYVQNMQYTSQPGSNSSVVSTSTLQVISGRTPRAVEKENSFNIPDSNTNAKPMANIEAPPDRSSHMYMTATPSPQYTSNTAHLTASGIGPSATPSQYSAQNSSISVVPRSPKPNRSAISNIMQAMMAPTELKKRIDDGFDFDQNIGGVGPTVQMNVQRKK
ncbi:Krev interaction trapped protein 1 [Batrachochytrium dendrobatidis]